MLRNVLQEIQILVIARGEVRIVFMILVQVVDQVDNLIRQTVLPREAITLILAATEVVIRDLHTVEVAAVEVLVLQLVVVVAEDLPEEVLEVVAEAVAAEVDDSLDLLNLYLI